MSDNSINSSQDDFNIKEQLKGLKEDISRPDTFGEIFKEASEKSKDIDSSIGRIVQGLIKNDKGIRDQVNDIVKEYDKSLRETIRQDRIKFLTPIIYLFIGSILTISLSVLKKILGL